MALATRTAKHAPSSEVHQTSTSANWPRRDSIVTQKPIEIVSGLRSNHIPETFSNEFAQWGRVGLSDFGPENTISPFPDELLMGLARESARSAATETPPSRKAGEVHNIGNERGGSLERPSPHAETSVHNVDTLAFGQGND